MRADPRRIPAHPRHRKYQLANHPIRFQAPPSHPTEAAFAMDQDAFVVLETPKLVGLQLVLLGFGVVDVPSAGAVPHERFATRLLPRKPAACTASPSSAARKIIRLWRLNVSTLDLSFPRTGMSEVVDCAPTAMVVPTSRIKSTQM